ncbi:MAG: isocitrate lyase/phosphoenolpyruvate mutase family protein [Acidimicrobiales bacterium]
MTDLRDRFRQLHQSGTFVLANAWDVGSARLLASAGFPALATTSAGFAASLGRMDQHVSRDELVAHVAALCSAVDLPLNVDAEHGFPDQPGGIARTVELLAAAGASGLSIEDWNPAAGRIESVELAEERVGLAAHACRAHGIVLTGRAENHLHGIDDLPDTIDRLRRYAAAGAEVVYAPGLRDLTEIATVVQAVPAPLNVLALAKHLTVGALAPIGVRRVSLGGMFAFAAYGALVRAAAEVAGSGGMEFMDGVVPPAVRAQAFGKP